ncbi:MAG: NAD(P)-dependent oxidoreductase [Acidimicrobiales bacterium]
MGLRPAIAVAPQGVRSWLADAAVEGGAALVDLADAEGLVWAEPAAAGALADLLDAEASGVRWVQLPWAGVEPYVEVMRAHAHLLWTCGKGVYAEPVAEHALALLLGGLRGVGRYARQTAWSEPYGTNLLGAKVVIVGGGGIAESLLRLLGPFGAAVTVVRRHPRAMNGAASVVGVEELDRALDGAVGVVLALALTPETDGIIGATQLAAMHERGWIVNVARGAHIVVDDLLVVLDSGTIGGAALDVTDPEPLPSGHPLWGRPDVIITPHVANTPEMAVPLLAGRIAANVARWAAGDELLGRVDPDLGY